MAVDIILNPAEMPDFIKYSDPDITAAGSGYLPFALDNQTVRSAISIYARVVASAINDCKYGINALGGRMGLTLMKSVATPAIHGEYGVHSFRYAVMPYSNTFAGSEIIEKAYEFNMHVKTVVGKAEEKSFINVSESNIILETVKIAKDGSSDMIIRLYEAMNTRTTVALKVNFDVKSAYITDMLEANKEALKTENGKIKLDIKPLTLRLKR